MRYCTNVKVYDDLPAQGIVLPNTLEEYKELWASIQAQQGDYPTWRALMRLWSAGDHVFFLLFVSNAGREAWNTFRHEPHFWHPVHIEIGREIQFGNANDSLLIGARGLGKSTHYDADDLRAKLVDPNHATFLFSLTKLLAQKHLQVLATEMETNDILKDVWDDRFWRNAEERQQAASQVAWGMEKGYTIKRTSTRPEQSFEAQSFEYQLPTGMHPDRRRYDDIEADRTVASALTSETIEDRWVSSQNLSSSARERRVTGTYYAPDALMVRLQSEYGLTPKIYPGEKVPEDGDPVPFAEAGPLGGRPVNGFTRDELWTRLKDSGGAEFIDGEWRRTQNSRALVDYGRQTGCDPLAGEVAKLDWRWIQFYDGEGPALARLGNVVINVDPAGATSKNDGLHDPTSIFVWLLTRQREFYWIDGERRICTPSERRELIYQVTQRWINFAADVVQRRIEQFGQATFVEDQRDFEATMPNFPAPPIVQCNDNRSPGRGEGKVFRNFNRWQPAAASGKVFFPRRMLRRDERGVLVDLVHFFKTFEWGMFPKSKSDGLLDSGGLIWEDVSRVGPLPWPVEASRWEFKGPKKERTWQAAGIF